MKHIINLFLGLFFIAGYSQENTVVSGGIASGSNGSVSYTIGQIDYTYQISSMGSVSQGLQQTYEVTTLKTKEPTAITLVITVFPNPSSDVATLSVADYGKWDNLTYQLVDINGRIIQQNQKITEKETSINVSPLPTGIYILELRSNQEIVKSFKIVKNKP